jgi:hypothetical protein
MIWAALPSVDADGARRALDAHPEVRNRARLIRIDAISGRHAPDPLPGGVGGGELRREDHLSPERRRQTTIFRLITREETPTPADRDRTRRRDITSPDIGEMNEQTAEAR